MLQNLLNNFGSAFSEAVDQVPLSAEIEIKTPGTKAVADAASQVRQNSCVFIILEGAHVLFWALRQAPRMAQPSRPQLHFQSLSDSREREREAPILYDDTFLYKRTTCGVTYVKLHVPVFNLLQTVQSSCSTE